jgi:hypothetical protein
MKASWQELIVAASFWLQGKIDKLYISFGIYS